MNRFLKWCLLCMTAGTIFLNLSVPVSAHTDNSEGYSNITFDQKGVRYELKLDFLVLARLIDFGIPADPTPNQMSQALVQKTSRLGHYLENKLLIYNHGALVKGKIIGTDVVRKKGRDYAKIILHFPIEHIDSSAIQITYNVFFDDNDPMHRNIASYQLGEENGHFVFTTGKRNFHVGEETIFGQCVKFVQLGFHHILIGYDHILFIIALVLTSRKISDVLKVLTLFTIAHSVTLGLAALELLSIPSEIVEPLIALSIAFVAIESLLGISKRFKYGVVFLFGLIHGIGFAGGLHILDSSIWKSLIPILTFNVGVEAGQLFIVILVFPLLYFIRKCKWSIPIYGVAHAAIFLIGLTWYFQRVFT